VVRSGQKAGLGEMKPFCIGLSLLRPLLAGKHLFWWTPLAGRFRAIRQGRHSTEKIREAIRLPARSTASLGGL